MEEIEFNYDEPRASFDLLKARFALCQGDLQRAKAERDEALELVDQMRESLQESSEVIEGWIEVFDMQQDERGVWMYDHQKSLWDDYDDLLKEWNKLIRDWNKFVPKFNATICPKDPGRPLAASDEQIKRVRALRKAGKSLRAISQETGLGVRTVRTILDNAEGKGRTAQRKAELRKREFNRLRAAAFRARKRKFEEHPKRLNAMLIEREKLLKRARGLLK